MSRLSALLQEPATTGERRARTTTATATETVLCSLREQMAEASSDEARGRRRGLKERLGFGFIGIGCCGVAISVAEEEEEPRPEERDPSPEREADPDPRPGMNLATALAAERQFRSGGGDSAAAGRVSLMRLLEESERCGGEEAGWCCVCMGRRKGAAFIPCGHTFCRVCSRELWLNRGSCPLCNRPILEILDIF